jgi:prolyl-tRNA editing enzyme YbaK/EbsC (Cys-tRNA(Pro) deacylase)
MPPEPTDTDIQPVIGGQSRGSAVERVRAALAAHGLTHVSVREFAERTATAAAAADAIGTSVDRIVKSLVFMADAEPILVLAAGTNRVDVDKMRALVGQPISRASAEQVRAHTSFAIGGVPPVGYPRRIDVYVDRDLLQFDLVWAAAGTPNSVFSIEPRELVRITAGEVADVALQP